MANIHQHLVPFSFGQIARSHGLDYAGQIAIPYLGVVGEKAFTREFTERFIEAKTQGSGEMKIIKDGTHFSTYDKPEYVAEGADALSEFFNKHLV
ncbi:alpha/beta hydrolase [Algibacter lectus]|uniref:alpha/beta hydrolase n=1 Tax=Algibacter lectus TaxID=221126 RepID=UPI001269DCCB|nr:alpha/beta hydrolase [Algibacter lectus]